MLGAMPNPFGARGDGADAALPLASRRFGASPQLHASASSRRQHPNYSPRVKRIKFSRRSADVPGFRVNRHGFSFYTFSSWRGRIVFGRSCVARLNGPKSPPRLPELPARPRASIGRGAPRKPGVRVKPRPDLGEGGSGRAGMTQTPDIPLSTEIRAGTKLLGAEVGARRHVDKHPSPAGRRWPQAG